MKTLQEFYNKFNEDKRLLRPYGRIEYETTMRYIHRAIQTILKNRAEDQQKSTDHERPGETADDKPLQILDIGAATGRYTIPLAEEGYRVTAVELVKYNLGILKQKAKRSGLLERDLVEPHVGNALNLKKYPSDFFDIVLVLGPMYHLFSYEDKLKALLEARRCLKKDGIMLVAYCMNEFAVIQYGFLEKNILHSRSEGKVSDDFHVRNTEEDLFDFVRIEDIDRLNLDAGLRRQLIISPDGAANYMRREISEMDEETFQAFLAYHFATCERMDLIGAGGHTLDIVTKL